MPSDAYMEVAAPEVWGETVDAQLEQRKLGAYEIANFGFRAGPPDLDEIEQKARGTWRPPPTPQTTGGPLGSGQRGPTSPTEKEPVVKTFTVSKAIDKSSPDLFLCCCQKLKMDWAIVTMREAGDASGKPYLVIEFTNLYIDSFQWNVSPGQGGDSSLTEEQLEFRFETVLMKYRQQTPEGGHVPAPLIKGFNRVDPKQAVLPLPFNQDM